VGGRLMAKKKQHELPHKTIKKVQKGLETLKKKAQKQKHVPSDSLLKSVEDLNQNLVSLSNLFKEAGKDIKEEEEIATDLNKKIDPLIEKVNILEDENKKIAQGILTVADMIQELKNKLERPRPMPKPKKSLFPMFRAPRMPRPGPMPPRPPGAAMPPPSPIPAKEMPTPPMPKPPRPPMSPGIPPLEEKPPGLPPLGPPPKMPEKPPEFKPLPEAPPPGMPAPGALPPLPGAPPPAPKKKGFFARLFKR
jgi:hypothetical protein